jgi:cardiolipin synthase (CMP-forming)
MIPNLISLSRIILIPIFLYLLFLPDVKFKIAALVVFIIASVTDILDGWSARQLKQESEFGKFLDPLADKFLVIATLVSFVIIDPLIPMWMILIIVGRDLLITVMRYAGIKKGMSLRTSRFGKVKTGFQMVSIVIIIMVFIVKSFGIHFVSQSEIDRHIKFKDAIELTMSLDNANPYKWLIIGPYWLMMVVTIITALSGIRYLMFNWKLLLPPYAPKSGKK